MSNDKKILLEIVNSEHTIESRGEEIMDLYIEKSENINTKQLYHNVQQKISRLLSELYHEGEIGRFRLGRQFIYCSKLYEEVHLNI